MPVVSRDMIEARAYQIWEQEGRPHGRDVEHWIKAAEELVPAEPAAKANGTNGHAAPKAKAAAPRSKAAAKPKAAEAAAAAPAPVAKTPAAKGKRTTTKAK